MAITTAPPLPADQTTPATGSVADGLVLVVAPCNGRFHPVRGDGPVAAGDLVAQVTAGGRAHPVHIPVTAQLGGLLTLPGQLVAQGQGLAWATTTERRRA